MHSDQASRTARAVAIGRAVGVAGIRDPLVARLLPRRDQRTVAALRRLPGGRPAIGLAAHAALRMHAVDRALDEAIATADPATVVVLGAGWDTRAWRLASLHGRRVVEVDHPATQHAKRARLATLGDPAAQLVFAPADLRIDALDDVLDRAGQVVDRPVVWLWEAVVPYLPPSAVDATLAVLARRSTPGSRLLVTTMPPGLLEPFLPGLSASVHLGLGVLGEPIRTAESDAEVAARLARHGWRGRGGRGPRSWAHDAGVAVAGVLLDERLHVATRAGSAAATDMAP